MMKLSAVLIILVLVLIPLAPALAQDEQPKLDQVVFSGNKSIPKEKLFQVMETKLPPTWKIWEAAPRYSPAALSRDVESITRLYKANGFYSVKAKTDVEVKADRAGVRIEITEGRPVKLRKIELTVTPDDPQMARTLYHLPSNARFAAGKVFKLDDYSRFKSNLIRYLSALGRPSSQVKAKVYISAAQAWADVKVAVQVGPVLKMGPARFEGNERTKTSLLARELAWETGEQYDGRLLDETRKRLVKLGVFSSVKVVPELNKISGHQVPIKVVLVERSSYSTSFGVGYGTEDSFRARIIGSARSIFGLAETISATAHYSGRSQGGLLSYRQVSFLDRQQTLDVRLGHHDRDEVSYSNQRSYFQVGLNRPLSDLTAMNLGYTLEVDRPYNIETARTLKEAQSNWVSSVSAGFVADTRDNVLNPKDGFRFNIKAEAAPHLLGSEVEYFRLESSYNHYQPINSWLILAFRFRLAAIRPYGDTDRIPIFKRLFAGGGKSVRGYPYQMLGPLDRAGQPIGGERLIEASIEGRFPLWGPVTGVVFSDTGQVAEEVWDWDQAPFQYTAGVGLRYATIIGPIRLDVGYQLNPPERADFDRWQVHFSIGQAF